MEVGYQSYPNAKVCFILCLTKYALSLLIEPISCSVPSLPPNARYLNHNSSIQKITDGSHLEYVCGHSRHRRLIHCRKGKLLPKVPRCFHGKIN